MPSASTASSPSTMSRIMPQRITRLPPALVAITPPIIADPLGGTINGKARLTQAEVRQVIALAAARTRQTRAGIRLPAGQPMQVFITVVNNPNVAGVPATGLKLPAAALTNGATGSVTRNLSVAPVTGDVTLQNPEWVTTVRSLPAESRCDDASTLTPVARLANRLFMSVGPALSVTSMPMPCAVAPP